MSEMVTATAKNKKRLKIVFGLTVAYMFAEAIGGYLTNSLALLADAGHMLTDASALGFALLAAWFAARPATPNKTYGYYRAEILAAAVNAIALIFISFFILYEAWQRWNHPPEVLSWPMLIVASVGLVVNFAGMKLLMSGAGESLNVKGAYLEVLGDMLGSIGAIAASIIMLTTGWYRADPLISAGIGLFILPRTWKLLSEAVHVLMEGTPAGCDLRALEAAMRKAKGVLDVSDLHVWSITSGVNAMSAHVRVRDLSEGDRVLRDLRSALQDGFGIGHSTIELETESHGAECSQMRLGGEAETGGRVAQREGEASSGNMEGR